MPGNAFSSFADSILRGGGLALSAQMLNQQAQQEQAIALQREQREYDAQLEERRNQQTLDLEERRAAYQDGKEYVKWLRDQAVGIRKLKPEDNPDYDLAGKYEAQANQIQNYLGGYVRSPNFVAGLASLKATPLTYNQQATVAAYETTPNGDLPPELAGTGAERFYEGYSNAAGSKQVEIEQSVTAEEGAGIATAATATAETSAKRLERIQNYQDSFRTSMATGLMNLMPGLAAESQKAVLAVVTNLANPDAPVDLTSIPGLTEKIRPQDVTPAIVGLQGMLPEFRTSAEALRQRNPNDPQIAYIDAVVAEINGLGQLAVQNPTQALERAIALGKTKVKITVNGEEVEVNPQELIRGGSRAALATGGERAAFDAAQAQAKNLPADANPDQQETADIIIQMPFEDWSSLPFEDRKNLLSGLRKTIEQMAIPDVLSYLKTEMPLASDWNTTLENDPNADPLMKRAAAAFAKKQSEIKKLGLTRKGTPVADYGVLDSEGVQVVNDKGEIVWVNKDQIKAAAAASVKNEPIDTRGFDYQAHMAVSLSDDYDKESRDNATANAAAAKAGKPLPKPTNYKKITDAKTLAQNKLTTLLSASTALNNQKSPLSDDQQTARSTIAGMTPEELMSNPEMYSTLLDMMRSDDPDLSVQAPFLSAQWTAANDAVKSLSRQDANPKAGALEAAKAIAGKLEEAISLVSTNPKRAQQLLDEVRAGVGNFTLADVSGAAADAETNIQNTAADRAALKQWDLNIAASSYGRLVAMSTDTRYQNNWPAIQTMLGTLTPGKVPTPEQWAKIQPLIYTTDYVQQAYGAARYSDAAAGLAYLEKNAPDLFKKLPKEMVDGARDGAALEDWVRQDTALSRVSDLVTKGDVTTLHRYEKFIRNSPYFGTNEKNSTEYFEEILDLAGKNKVKIEDRERIADKIQALQLGTLEFSNETQGSQFLNTLVSTGSLADINTLLEKVRQNPTKYAAFGFTEKTVKAAYDRAKGGRQNEIYTLAMGYAALGNKGKPLIDGLAKDAKAIGVNLNPFRTMADDAQVTADRAVRNENTQFASTMLETWADPKFAGQIADADLTRFTNGMGFSSNGAAATYIQAKRKEVVAAQALKDKLDKLTVAKTEQDIAASKAAVQNAATELTIARGHLSVAQRNAEISQQNANTASAGEQRLAAAKDDPLNAAKLSAKTYTDIAKKLRTAANDRRNPRGVDNVFREVTPTDIAAADALDVQAAQYESAAVTALAPFDPNAAALLQIPPPPPPAGTGGPGGSGSGSGGSNGSNAGGQNTFTPRVGTSTARSDGGLTVKIGADVIQVSKERKPKLLQTAVQVGRANEAVAAELIQGLMQEWGWQNSQGNFERMYSLIATVGAPPVTPAPKR
jgi:hypothetical protein